MIKSINSFTYRGYPEKLCTESKVRKLEADFNTVIDKIKTALLCGFLPDGENLTI